MSDFIPFKRYQAITDDWNAFQETLLRPLPTCIWTNTLRTTPEQLAQFLAADDIPYEPLPWYPGAFKLPPDFKPGRHWAFLAGLYHVQEEVSLLPLIFLDPQPGERILDLCAAPGNKTAQIAVQLANRGTVTANDIDAGRMRALRQTQERLGLINLTTTIYDAANYPGAAGLFDKVLVDVPCSCEGTSRKEPSVLYTIGPQLSCKKNGAQLAMLRKAVQLCRPGGRIVYATCTYAPEENEWVVDAVLRERGSDIRLVPAELDGFTTSPGLTHWQGEDFQPPLRQTMRVWPQQNDTGGFFIAVLERCGEAPADGDEAAAPVTANYPPMPAGLFKLLTERFGLRPDIFESYSLFQQSQRRVYAVNQDHQPPTQPQPDAIGMLFMKTRIKYPKLSTAAAQAFGSAATQNYIETDEAQIQTYLNRQDFQISAAQGRYCAGPGYVLVRHRGFTLGVGLYRPDASEGGTVQSMFPKGWSPRK